MYERSQEIKDARKAANDNAIPEKAFEAFRMHFHNAKRRKIAFEFTLPEWWAWWQANHWEKRGNRIGCYVMARRGDTGPYAVWNVYAATMKENANDVPFENRSLPIKTAHAINKADPSFKHHLAVRGDAHPKAKAVITPKGRFGSAALAAEAYGITRQYAARMAKAKQQGWSVE